MRDAPITLILVALLAGCDVPAEHPALKQAALPPLIQAHRFAYHGCHARRLSALARRPQAGVDRAFFRAQRVVRAR